MILAVIFSGVFSYRYGVKNTYERMSKQHTFYANIIKIEEDHFFVKGIELNEKNYRGYWICILSDDTYFGWNAIPRQKSDRLKFLLNGNGGMSKWSLAL